MAVFSYLKDRIQGRAPKGERRSPMWPRVRAEHLKTHPQCEVCGGTKRLNVHHIEPFHLNRARELDPTNLITLCESKHGGVNCHLHFGHLGNYKQVNREVPQDSTTWAQKLKAAREWLGLTGGQR